MATQTEELFQAILDGDESRVEFLLAADPGVAFVRNAEGVSAVMLALYQGHREIGERLAGVKDQLTIWEVASLGMTERLKKMIAADPMTLRANSPDGFTVLHLAAYFGQVDCVELLLAAGAGVAARSINQMDNTPLHAALAHQHVDVARVLLEHGAPVNAKQAGGYTALHAAAHRG